MSLLKNGNHFYDEMVSFFGLFMKHNIEVLVCQVGGSYIGIPSKMINEIFPLDPRKIFFKPKMLGIQVRNKVKGFLCLSKRYRNHERVKPVLSSYGVDIIVRGKQLVLGVNKAFALENIEFQKLQWKSNEGIVAVGQHSEYGSVGVLSPLALIKILKREALKS